MKLDCTPCCQYSSYGVILVVSIKFHSPYVQNICQNFSIRCFRAHYTLLFGYGMLISYLLLLLFLKTLISPKIAIFNCQHLNYAPVKQVLTLDLNKINFIGRCLFALNIFGSWSIPFLASGLIVSSDRKVSVTGTEPGGASRGHGTPVLLVLLVKFSLFCTVWLLLTKKIVS
jgi:hypothetical protein